MFDFYVFGVCLSAVFFFESFKEDKDLVRGELFPNKCPLWIAVACAAVFWPLAVFLILYENMRS